MCKILLCQSFEAYFKGFLLLQWQSLDMDGLAMKTKISNKLVKNMTPEEYRACYRLNMGSRGTMQSTLTRAKNHYADKARAIMVKSESGEIMGWALLMPCLWDTGIDAQFYVRKVYRRRGIGKRLMYHTRKYDDKPWVHPHNRTSGRFFRNFTDVVRGTNSWVNE